MKPLREFQARMFSRVFFALLGAFIYLSAPADLPVFAAGSFLDPVDEFMDEGSFAKWKAELEKKYGLSINPYIKSGFEFTTNTFKSPYPTRHDGLWNITPGINATLTQKWGEAGLSYELPLRYFSRYSDQNELDQSFSTYVSLYPTEKLNIQLSEELAQQGGTAGAPAVKPLNSRDNTLKGSVIYKFL